MGRVGNRMLGLPAGNGCSTNFWMGDAVTRRRRATRFWVSIPMAGTNCAFGLWVRHSPACNNYAVANPTPRTDSIAAPFVWRKELRRRWMLRMAL
jgi:hypothetical protein